MKQAPVASNRARKSGDISIILMSAQISSLFNVSFEQKSTVFNTIGLFSFSIHTCLSIKHVL